MLGEVKFMLHFLKHDPSSRIISALHLENSKNSTSGSNFNMFFKLSGRYFINSFFDYRLFNEAPGESVVLVKDDQTVSTRLFMIRNSFFPSFLSGLERMLLEPTLLNGQDYIENMIARFAFPDTNSCIQRLGVSGMIAVDKSVIDE